MSNYKELCENTFFQWKNKDQSTWGKLPSFLELDACPEPYLSFGDYKSSNMAFLTTNPGGVMENGIQGYESLILKGINTYQELSAKFVEYYSSAEFGRIAGSASSRVRGMFQVAKHLGFIGFTQYEICPFHSVDFKNKEDYVSKIGFNGFLSQYTQLLKEELKGKRVVAIQGVGSPKNINEYTQTSVWLKFIYSLIDLEVEAKVIQLKDNTGAFKISGIKTNGKKTLTFCQRNSLPAIEELLTII